MCNVTPVSWSVSAFVTFHVFSKVTFYCVWLRCGFVPSPVPHFLFVSYSLLFHLVCIVLTVHWVFFLGGGGSLLLSRHLHVSPHQHWCVTSKFIHCATRSEYWCSWVSECHPCMCMIASVSATRSCCLYLLPDLWNPSLLNMSTLMRAFISPLTTFKTHTTFLLQESLCHTHEDSIPVIVACTFPLYVFILVCYFFQPINTVHCQGTHFPSVMESVEGNSMDGIAWGFPFLAYCRFPLHSTLTYGNQPSALVGNDNVG